MNTVPMHNLKLVEIFHNKYSYIHIMHFHARFSRARMSRCKIVTAAEPS